MGQQTVMSRIRGYRNNQRPYSGGLIFETMSGDNDGMLRPAMTIKDFGGDVDIEKNLNVKGNVNTNSLLINKEGYTNTLPSQVYNANKWYTAIEPGVLTAGCTYIITLQYNGGTTPWNLYTSFLHFCGTVNEGPENTNSMSGAAVPTSIHANNLNGVDYQIYVRGKYNFGSSSGVEFKIAGNTGGPGVWIVKAYRII